MLLLAGSVIVPGNAHCQAEPARRPNIVLIMSDDMGYSDTAPYGGEIETPVLSRLADGGLRFTQFYNTARCCPTRASLMSGLYPHQAGIGWMMQDLGHDGYRGDLSNRCVTIAEALRPAGYATFMTGKWHVTPRVRPNAPQYNWPRQRGFDRFYGTIHGAGSFFDPSSLTRDDRMISPFNDPEYQPEQYYYTDAISDQASRYIREHLSDQKNAERPFFLYVAYTAAHWPMHALPGEIEKYRGRYDGGYASIRAARLQRMREMGLIDPQWELTPQAVDWDSVEDKAWQIRCMEVFAAMVDRLDQGIGRIVNTLEEQGQLDNTLILFLQDNGGCAETLGWFSQREPKERPAAPTFDVIPPEALQLVATPEQTRDGYPVRMGRGVMPGPADTYIAYGEGWANVSNTPFREYKHWVHEGGISTPLIAHWPEGISRRGEFERQPGHLIDIMATCLDLAGAEYPETFRDQPIKPFAGKSLVPAFRGDQIEREAIYFEHEGNRAIRVDNWKLVAKENAPWELYDMLKDRSEMHDLAAAHPDVVEKLSGMWDAWAERADVLPLGAWRSRRR